MTEAATATLPRRIGGRYEVHGVLGRGGMAAAYHVTDVTTGKELALKQLLAPEGEKRNAGADVLFEREFRTLTQLSHPRIIEVYDYGVADDGPFYTMELLDGGDLRQRTPVPWREACALSYDVCSSLALIHSRRLVHRDVTPRNIRCTRDGQAKLIDFGAMVPMGPGGVVVGTPSFVAPEVVLGSAVDARADLFSFGATLYFALTGRAPYPARDFTELPEVWKNKPPRPSHFAEGVPGALDALILSLLDLDSSMRPHTAFEVMHRLSAIAGLERVEPPGVSRAYLTTPAMVGRDDVVAELRSQMGRAFGGRGRSVLIVGAPGIGRSRVLDACALTAKILGATVLRAAAKMSHGDYFAVARALTDQLVRVLPEARARVPALEGSGAAESLVRFMLEVSAEHPLLLAVDDLEHVDTPSAALLAALASQAKSGRLLVAVTAETASSTGSALGVLAAHGKVLTLNPLTAGHTEELLESVFGDVPNVGLVSAEIHAVSRGNPRVCMDLAQHLVDRGRVLYDAGTWTLPSSLDGSDLPGSAEEAIRERLGTLSALSRLLAESQALASHAAFTREDYALLCPEESSDQVDRAVAELLTHQILVSDGRLLTLSHAGWAAALKAQLTGAQRMERHRALVRVYETKPGLSIVSHLFAAGAPEAALDRLGKVLSIAGDAIGVSKMSDLNSTEIAEIFEHSVDAARALERPPRELNDLRRWLASQSVSTDHAFYWCVAPDWLAQLVHDTGLDRFRELTHVEDEAERRSQAMAFAYQRYDATPERERVYRPDEALTRLVHYVVISIAIGSRTHDVPLLRSLPPLLEPFLALSPVIEAMWHNAVATREAVCDGQSEQYLDRTLALYRRLEQFSKEELPHVELIRHAIEFGLGAVSANLGLSAAATQWAELLEQDSLHQVNALYLRKAIRLQAGDWEGAEEFRKQAEVLALRARTRQMFDSTLTLELSVHAMARDLTGLKQVTDRIELRAARSAGWVPYRHIAEGHFQYICGNFEPARAAFALALALSEPDPADQSRVVAAFPSAMAGVVASLVGLRRAAEAKAEGERALEACTAHAIGAQAHGLVRALSLAEAELGDYAAASERLEHVIAKQTALGVTGLLLGATYEARARVAIRAGDEAAVEKYGRLTAEEYRHGLGSPLGAHYERLMDEARRSVAATLPKLWHFESTRMAGNRESPTAMVTQLLRGAETVRERAARVLHVLCTGHAASEGHLYLCEEDGPKLIVSQGCDAPPYELLEYVRDQLARDVSAGDVETAMLSDASALAELSPVVFRDDRGRLHRPVSLNTVVDHVARCAAIAVVVDAANESRVLDFALTSALAGHLIEAGDTEGVAVGC